MADYTKIPLVTPEEKVPLVEAESPRERDRLIEEQNTARQDKSIRKSVKDAVDNVFHFEYQTHQGHEGQVLCVDGSDGMGWILSGGKDNTARLWHYSEQDYQCYRLAKVWNCGSPVTSVAFAGEDGPAIVVTEGGNLYVQGTSSKEAKCHMNHTTRMNDLRVKREVYKDNDTWLLVTATGNSAYLRETYPSANSKLKGLHPSVCHYECREVAEFPHDDEVEIALHVPGYIKKGACVATLSANVIRLISLEGSVLQKLAIPGENWESFHVSDSPAMGWLAAASESTVYMWPLADGTIIEPVFFHNPAPVAKYDDFPSGLNDVMMHKGNEFFMVQRGDMSFELRYVGVDKIDEGVEYLCAADPSKHSLKLIKPADITSDKVTVIKQTVKSHEMCLAFDDEIGAVALCGFKNGIVGCWDLEGKDGGEMTSDIRSMSLVEVFTPILLRFVTFVQVTTYAFGPSTKFTKGVEKPVEISRSIAVLDVEVAIDIDPAKFFIPAIEGVFFFAGAFLLIVLFKIPERLTNAVNAIMRSERYGSEAKEEKEEEKEGGSKKWSWTLGPAHFCATVVSLIRSVVAMLIILSSSVLIVPISKKFAQLVDCEHPEEGPAFLSADPSIKCWESQHLFFVRILVVIWPIYILTLIPYVLVGGDSNYMKRAQVLDCSCWGSQARRKATVLYIGILHPRPTSIVSTKLVEFVTKIALPVIVIETTHSPLIQTVLVASCGLLGVLCTIMFPPLVEHSWNAIERSLQFFTFLSMLCGMFSVLFPGTGIADSSLLVSLVVCLVACYCQIRRAGKSKDEEDNAAHIV